MVIKELLSYGEEVLISKYKTQAIKESYLLLAHVLKQNKSYIITHQNEKVSTYTIKEFKCFINKRNNNVPIAYIINKAYFMDLELDIEEGVLIPRQDSEVLIEELLKRNINDKVLDLCCGSGVLGIAYAYYNKNANVTFVDISEKCISITKKNIVKNKLQNKIKVIKSDLFNKVNGKYDLIISNPPYIKSGDIDKLMVDVKMFEPHIALDGGEKGLYFYNRIIRDAKSYLNDKGSIAVEIGIDQSEEVINIFNNYKYNNIQVYKDYNNIDRVIIANN